jgi:hypothetical protein
MKYKHSVLFYKMRIPFITISLILIICTIPFGGCLPAVPPLKKRNPGYYTNGLYVTTPMIIDMLNEKANYLNMNLKIHFMKHLIGTLLLRMIRFHYSLVQ